MAPRRRRRRALRACAVLLLGGACAQTDQLVESKAKALAGGGATATPRITGGTQARLHLFRTRERAARSLCDSACCGLRHRQPRARRRRPARARNARCRPLRAGAVPRPLPVARTPADVPVQRGPGVLQRLAHRARHRADRRPLRSGRVACRRHLRPSGARRARRVVAARRVAQPCKEVVARGDGRRRSRRRHGAAAGGRAVLRVVQLLSAPAVQRHRRAASTITLLPARTRSLAPRRGPRSCRSHRERRGAGPAAVAVGDDAGAAGPHRHDTPAPAHAVASHAADARCVCRRRVHGGGHGGADDGLRAAVQLRLRAAVAPIRARPAVHAAPANACAR